MGTAQSVRKLLLVPSLLVVSEICAIAEIYKYVDGRGTIHFVDDAGKIPKESRNRNLVHYYDDYRARPANKTTKVTILSDQVLIPVTLHFKEKSVTGLFLIDTGATMTTITPEMAQELGVDLSLVKLTVGQVAGGAILAGMAFTVDRIDVGPNSSRNLEVNIIRHEGPPVQFDGMLGMNYLRSYRYVIDVENKLVQWE